MGKRQQACSFLRDFKDFLNRGNVVDLAVVSLVMGALINFAVISFVVFVIIRALEKLKRREAETAGPNSQQQLADAANRLATALERRQL